MGQEKAQNSMSGFMVCPELKVCPPWESQVTSQGSSVKGRDWTSVG